MAGMRGNRCQSWRRGARSHDPIHMPGECVRCWCPCRNVVEQPGARRCQECLHDLMALPEPWIRDALANEPSANRATIDVLMSEDDAKVATPTRVRREPLQSPTPPPERPRRVRSVPSDGGDVKPPAARVRHGQATSLPGEVEPLEIGVDDENW
jgi:hypothetical protein